MPDVVLRKMPPERFIPQLRRKASEKLARPAHDPVGLLHRRNLGAKMVVRSITFEDNEGDVRPRPKSGHFLQQFPSVCETDLALRKLPQINQTLI
jgi:hypothetical protein